MKTPKGYTVLFVEAEDGTVDGQYNVFKNGADTGVYVQVCLPDDYETFSTTYMVGRQIDEETFDFDWTEFRSLDRAISRAFKWAQAI